MSERQGKIAADEPSAIEAYRERLAQAKQALRESEEAVRRGEFEVRQVFEHSPVGIFRTTPEGRILLANPAILETMGYSSVEAMNAAGLPNLYVDREERERLVELLKRGTVDAFETRVRRADGIVIEIVLNVYPVRDSKGELRFLEGNLIDITGRKLMEAQLRQSEKMQAIGQLAGGIAHDFNNQLAGIIGHAELLREQLDGDEHDEHIEGIIGGAQRAADLTAALLAFSQQGKYVSEEVDMHGVARDVTRLLQRTVDKRIALRLDLEAERATTEGDPTLLRNALLNLALNGCDAMPDGGTLTFASEEVSLDPALAEQHSLAQVAERYLRLTVRDTGAGIEPGVHRQIFEPFFTTKQQRAGMGLAAVEGTAKSHGGLVTVASEPDEGARFALYLPLTDVAATPAKPPPEPQEPVSLPAGLRVLVAEDERIVRIISERMLQSLGCTVISCVDGQEALTTYEERWREIDLVLLDAIMPVYSGREVFLAMRQHNADVVAILASGFTNSEAQTILAEGVQGFLHKPFTKAQLEAKILEVLGS